MMELLLRLVFSLAVVLGLVMLAARVAQRRLGGRSGAALSVVHRQAVGRHASVAVVAVGGRTLLLGVTEQQVRMLTELDAADLAPAEAAPPEPAVERPAALAVAPLQAVDPVAGQPQDRPQGPGPDPSRDQAEAEDEHEQEDPEPGAAREEDKPFFAAVLREQSAAIAASATPLRHAPRRDDGPLAGSLLSPATWRRAVEAVRGQAS